jgi:protein SCO1
MKQLLFIAAIAFLGVPVCSGQEYPVKGLVLEVDAPHRSLVVSCDEIPNYMPPMVMPFTVRDTQELAELAPGVMIDFTLVVEPHSFHIEKLHLHRYEGLEQDPLGARRLKLIERISQPASQPVEIPVGASVPDFSLIDQNRQKIALSQFAGKIVLLTFTYTRCPLPDFCFRISNNFGQLQKRFADQMGRGIVFLSITFDPEHDTPEILAKYASTWKASSKGWHFLTGAKPEIERICWQFGMNFWPDEGAMTHSLHTVVIGPKGNLVANLEGNDFTAIQLGDFVQAILDQSRRDVRQNSSE